MAEPQLLVHQAQGFINRGALLGRHLDVGESEELKHLILGAPHTAELILRPAASRRCNDLAVAGALARPPARLEILLEDLDRRAIVALLFLDVFFAQDHVPGLAFLPPPRFAVPAAGPATFASKAAMRAFNISFSSRAAAAMALTASNSSRPTKSAPAIHSRIFSRALASASRPMPAKVPAKPFTIFTKSSNNLFSDCIASSPFRRGNRHLRRISPARARELSPTGSTIPNFPRPKQDPNIALGAGDGPLGYAEPPPPLRSNPFGRGIAYALAHSLVPDNPALADLLAP